MDRQPRWESTTALVSLLLLVLSWELTAALYAGRWLFGPDWFGPDREWAALAVSISLSAYHQFRGRHHVRVGGGSRRAVSGRQAVLVTGLVVTAGAFGTWLFVHGRD